MVHSNAGRAQQELAHAAEAKANVDERSEEYIDSLLRLAGLDAQPRSLAHTYPRDL